MKESYTRRFAFRFAVALFTFTLGVLSGALWYARRSHADDRPQKEPEAAREQRVDNRQEAEWPLTAPLVSRALQTRVITTKRLRRNGDDEVVWRWLKQSIAEYPQDWLPLKIEESESYFIVVYKADVLDAVPLKHYNKKLKALDLPILKAGKRYARLQINEGDVDCPNWTGLIDLEEAKLVYFESHSA